MQIISGVFQRKGLRAGVNQDSLCLQQARTKKGSVLFAAVCDGIGGLQEGEEASGYTVMWLSRWFYTGYRELFKKRAAGERILLSMQRQICHIQEHLKQYQKNNQIQSGTTLTAVLIQGRRYFLVHIGDSRAYVIKKKRRIFGKAVAKAVQLTWDDRNENGYLTRCLGAGGADRAFYATGKLKGRTGLLLCTDGFYEKLSEGEMANALCPFKIQEEEALIRRLELLGEQAVRGGSLDDMSAVYAVLGGK